MPRNRVLSFMSQWGPRSRESSPSSPTAPRAATQDGSRDLPKIDTAAAQREASKIDSQGKQSPVPNSPSTPSRARAESRGRPVSMVQTYQSPQIEVAENTPPELQPIFTFLNSHGNKLYQEGYFLKLHDLDSRGRPSADRTWVECFAQLVGTVLSLWDAAALDNAGVDGEVVPTFINLSDASLKMIESLPMSGAQAGKLQNVLSISTAANNRYLLHFNSLNSLTQWTAGIRLAMFEHSTLQEAYTGSLIAGKGKSLNNIRNIMERTRFVHEDWARVRFGAGTPWRRLWFVISPPDEKEFAKAQKMQKKGATYLRSQLPRGDIKFYESRKVTKKTKPVATINDVYAAYAIYPQSMPLIEQSTLVKMEGQVTIHSSPETSAEGFVFVMPEVHPAVSGFEMMLQWLFPVWDTFNLYGRPTRLIADTLDQRGLMFAMPRDRIYGYLDVLDVSGLIHENGSQTWTERQWRKQMKKLTSERMSTLMENGGRTSMSPRRSMNANRTSMPPVSRNSVRFDSGSQPGSRSQSPVQSPDFAGPRRVGTAPIPFTSPHKRSASDAQGYKRYQSDVPSRLSQEMARPEEFAAPRPPRHGVGLDSPRSYSPAPGNLQRIESGVATPTLSSLKAGLHETVNPADVPPEPVITPPPMVHNPSSRPANQLAVAPELRRAHSGVDAATLHQMHEAATVVRSREEEYAILDANMVNKPRTLERSNADQFQGPTSSDLRRALPTVEASPRPPEQYQSFSQAPLVQPIPVHKPHPLPQLPPEDFGGVKTSPTRPSMQATRSSQSISRKPVPQRSQGSATVNSSGGASTPSGSEPSEHGSLLNSYVDNDALEQILAEDARLNSMGSITSSATPDYASTVSKKSIPRRSVEKPRMGKLKTVGDPELASTPGRFDTYRADLAADQSEVPNVDFGPTHTYKPTTRPTTGNADKDRRRSQSGDRLTGGARRLSALMGFGQKNAANNRRSYYGAQDQDGMNQPGNRNSIAWMPSSSTQAAAPQSMTPEEWVQYRAAVASQPQLAPRGAHSRQTSTSTITAARRLSRTPPPFGRAMSGDWSQDRQTPPSRPNSRGAGVYLNNASPGSARPTTPTPNLSAKEQMYVARATGTPMINAQNSRYDNNQSGLLGAITAREQERAAVKEGMRSGMVEEAIRARQQQQAQIDADALRHQNFLAQQQQQQSMQAQNFQNNAYARSVLSQNPAPSAQAQSKRRSWRQSWFNGQPQSQRQSQIYQPQTPQQQWQPQVVSNGHGRPRTPGAESGYSSFYGQRLHGGQQQQQQIMQQQGQIPTYQYSPGQQQQMQGYIPPYQHSPGQQSQQTSYFQQR